MLSSIEQALLDIQQGKMIIVIDDENRENEGDFIMAAELATPEAINFMATHGKGLICAPITKERALKLELPLMVNNLQDTMGTAFTVSVDAAKDISTGISATDRAKTLKLLADSDTKPEDLVRPGHIFPLIAKKGGVLEREGHTEAAVDLAQMAGLAPAGIICEILNEDGSCARLDDLVHIAHKHRMKIITIENLIEYKKKLFLNSINEKGEEHGPQHLS